MPRCGLLAKRFVRVAALAVAVVVGVGDADIAVVAVVGGAAAVAGPADFGWAADGAADAAAGEEAGYWPLGHTSLLSRSPED
jgi:hypothetical protein